VSKAQDIRERADALIAEGKPRAEAFKQLAVELNIKLDSVRSAYYTAAKADGASGGRSSRPRRRETTLEAALADGRAALDEHFRQSTARSRPPRSAPRRRGPKPTR
jgi:hypothetical protein